MHPDLSAFLSRRLIDRSGGHRAAVLSDFKVQCELNSGSRADIEQVRREQLAALLRRVKRDVPFYRDRMAGGPESTSDSAMNVLATLPVLEREMIQQDPAAFRADGDLTATQDATGGSTGTPMRFWVDRETKVAREASLFWSDSLAGWRYGERIAMLWGSDKDVRTAGAALRSDLRWWLENRRWYNAFDMGPEQMRQYHAAMQRFRPHLLVAYAGSLFRYARFLEAEGLVPGYPERACVSSAEVISSPMRDVIERVFGRPVFDRYGNREFGAIAAECEVHDGLHLNERDMIVEVDSPDPTTEPGPLLVTYLRNKAMPFLRYNTGDLGLLAPPSACACGRTTRRLMPVKGRESDTIVTASGRHIHGEYFTHALYAADAVREFQFVQETLDDYVLKVVTDTAVSSEDERQWRAVLEDVLDPGVNLRIDRVDRIPVLPSGKHKFTVSLVP